MTNAKTQKLCSRYGPKNRPKQIELKKLPPDQITLIYCNPGITSSKVEKYEKAYKEGISLPPHFYWKYQK